MSVAEGVIKELCVRLSDFSDPSIISSAFIVI